MGKKSDAKHLFAEKYPTFFSDTPTNVPQAGCKIHITDALSYMWIMFTDSKDASGNTSNIKTADQFMKKMLELSTAPLLDGGCCDTHVVLFDKSEFTHITKSVELPPECHSETEKMMAGKEEDDNLRDRVNSIRLMHERHVRDGIAPCSFPLMCSEPDSFLPTPWAGVMKSRDTVRRWMVSCAILGLLDPGSSYAIKHQEGGSANMKTVIFDGHCLKVRDLINIPGFDMVSSFGVKCTDSRSDAMGVAAACGLCHICLSVLSADIYEVPVAVSFGSGNIRRVYLDHSLRNKIGEADFTVYHYVRKLIRRDMLLTQATTVDFMIHSIDVDILMLGLLFVSREEKGLGSISINTGFWKKISRWDRIQSAKNGVDVLHNSTTSRIKATYIDVRGLLTAMVGGVWLDHPGSLKFPPCNVIADFLCTLYSCGSDYTYGMDGVSMEAFYDAITKNYDSIGSIAKVECLDPGCEHMAQHGDAAVPLKKVCHQSSAELDPAAYGMMLKFAFLSTKHASKRRDDIDPTAAGFEDIRSYSFSAYPNSEEKHFPSVQRVFCMALSMQYYISMIGQVGCSDIVLPTGADLFLCGYGNALDFSTMMPKMEKLERGKVRMLCTDEIVRRKAHMVRERKNNKLKRGMKGVKKGSKK